MNMKYVCLKFEVLFLGKKGPCGQFGSGSICCTDDILHTYASSLDHDLNTLLDSEIIHISRVFAVAKQQTDGKC